PVSTGTGSIAGNLLTVTGAGAIMLDANQAGNGNYSAAAQVQREIDFNAGGTQLTLSPASVSLGNVAQGEVSALKPVTVKNTGTTTVTINGISTNAAPYAVDASSTCK